MRISTMSLACAWARSTSWSERAAALLALVFVLGVCAAALQLGHNTGQGIGNPAWRCDMGRKGLTLYCAPAKLDTQAPAGRER